MGGEIDDRINRAAAEMAQARAAEDEGLARERAERTAADRAAIANAREAAHEIRDLCRRFANWAIANGIQPQTMEAKMWGRKSWLRTLRLTEGTPTRNYPGWPLGRFEWIETMPEEVIRHVSALWVSPKGEIIAVAQVRGSKYNAISGPPKAPSDLEIVPHGLDSVEQSIAEFVTNSGVPWKA